MTRSKLLQPLSTALLATLLLAAMLAANSMPASAQDYPLVDPDPVDITIRVFVPSPAVDVPGYSPYGGDDRGFSPSQGTARVNIRLSVMPENGRIIESEVHADPTKRYREWDTVRVPGATGWWHEVVDGATPVEQETLNLDESRVSITNGYRGQDPVVKVEISAGNPLASLLMPKFDAELTFTFGTEGSRSTVAVTGTHDVFPNVEIYVEDHPIARWDAARQGKNPIDAARNHWVRVDSRWISDRPSVGANGDSSSGGQSGTNGSNWDYGDTLSDWDGEDAGPDTPPWLPPPSPGSPPPPPPPIDNAGGGCGDDDDGRCIA